VLSENAGTRFGFPEVQLGLIPGWGGTARLPRIVGLPHAVAMITSGDSVTAAEARAMGLADELVAADKLIEAAAALIRDVYPAERFAAHRRRLSAPVRMSDDELDFMVATASRGIAEKHGDRQPAPEIALRLLRENAAADLTAACGQASAAFRELLGSPVNRALLNVYMLREHNRRDAVVPGDVIERTVARVGIVGAGIMGVGVAAAHIKRGVPIRLADASDEALSRAMNDVLEEVVDAPARAMAHGEESVRRAASLLGRADSIERLADCDLILEAVVETAEVKRRLYQRLEPLLPEYAVIGSNTSTIPITSLAGCLAHPDRFCGIHFFNPVRHMRLVEVIRGERTSDSTIATVVAHAKRLGKMPIVVNDSPGFLVNRLLAPYLNESLELLIAGAAIEEIDRVAERFGMPLGPLALYDLIGIDTSFYAGRTIWEAFPDRIAVQPVLPALFRKGRLGQKAGAGFYRYEAGSTRWQPDPLVAELLEPYVRPGRAISPSEIEDRLLLPVLLEATRVLEAGVVRDIRDVDLGMIYGLGFPADQGGLLFWADTLGAAEIVRRLEPYASLGSRFQPTALLRQMAREDRRFYDGVPPEARVQPGGSA
jgi:3-hydroxyacyl-CoA dehydrogenase/enoyl-CoA hydratase/3-hydroxybutyryl-CoA epimerase/3-hydroxyacyl-CoA dehydrogenase/enoyl-CoA hydratase/3-hydroxybutyryl-CoA epimerase/enoyl-CoA isomerase